MSLKRSDLVVVLAEKIATDLFLSMLNPRRRGAKFRFSTFAIERWVQRHLGIDLPSAPSDKELAVAGTVARATWTRLIVQVRNGIPRRFR